MHHNDIFSSSSKEIRHFSFVSSEKIAFQHADYADCTIIKWNIIEWIWKNFVKWRYLS